MGGVARQAAEILGVRARCRRDLAGLGLALLPGYLADPMVRSGQLRRVLDGYVQTGSSLQAVYPHRRHLAGKVRALIDHLVVWFETHPVS